MLMKSGRFDSALQLGPFRALWISLTRSRGNLDDSSLSHESALLSGVWEYTSSGGIVLSADEVLFASMGVVAVGVVTCAVVDCFARSEGDGASVILVCFASSGGVALNSSLADARGFARIASSIDVGGGCAS